METHNTLTYFEKYVLLIEGIPAVIVGGIAGYDYRLLRGSPK